jgi:phage/plasmid-associated DNA primase
MDDRGMPWLAAARPQPPDAVKKATADYFATQNSFSLWLEECCERDPNAWTATTTLFTSWKAWAEKGGVRCGEIKTFGEAMSENGFERKHTKLCRPAYRRRPAASSRFLKAVR